MTPELAYALLPYLIAFLGASFGSLVSMLSYRIPRGEPIGMTRSRCPHCHTPLGITSLIPIFSWLMQRGACRHCSKPVHWRYPAIELCCMALTLTIFFMHGISLEALCLLLLGIILLTIIVIDFEHYIIPDTLQIVLVALALPYRFYIHQATILDMLTSTSIGLITGWALHSGYYMIKKKHGLGMGDVKFLAVAGLWLTPEGMITFFIVSGLLGVLTGITWQLSGLGKKFPFGPALAATLMLELLYPNLQSLQFATALTMP